jgi:arginase family enzyme
MEIEQYFSPVKVQIEEYPAFAWGARIKRFSEKEFPDLEGIKVAIIGVDEERNALENKGCGDAPDKIREALYNLSYVEGISVADLGNLKLGSTANDTYHALSFICSELIEMNIIPFIIGGSQELTFANYLGYQKRQQTVNLVCIDRKLDLGSIESDLDSSSYFNKILQYEPNLLFNYSLMGYQTHFVNGAEIEILKKMYFDLYRLGQLQANLEEAEPLVRNADILSFDISAVRRSDAPGTYHSTPNGLYGEEACQVFRYAGMSDKLTSVGIYEVNPMFDNRNQTSELAAQLIWYFLEGVANRKNDFPIPMEKDYVKYTVAIKAPDHELVFYKSNKTNRWWMEVPFRVGDKDKFERHHMVPCSYEDYQMACAEELPDRWWQAYQKLN